MIYIINSAFQGPFKVFLKILIFLLERVREKRLFFYKNKDVSKFINLETVNFPYYKLSIISVIYLLLDSLSIK